MSEGDQRRRERRFQLSWTVEISAAQWEEILPLATHNISRGGLFVKSEHYVEPGATVEIRLHLPDGGSLALQGKVAHSIRPEDAKGRGLSAGFGVRFAEAHATDLNLLEAIAASYAAGPHAYEINQKYVTLPAKVQGEGQEALETSAHHLLPISEDDLDHPRPSSSGPVLGGAAAEAHDSFIEITVDLEPEPKPTAEKAPSVEGPTPEMLRRESPLDPDRTIFGIDFGTSYTSIAVVDEERLTVLADEEGHTLIPSVVAYPPKGDPLVGWPAREQQIKYPSVTFVSPKRLLGRRFDDPNVDPIVGASPVRFQKGPEGKIVAEIYGDPVSMPQVCAEVIRRAMAIGEHATGVPVRRAVFSAPVGGEEMRAALRRAAQIAGVEVVSILSEPSSAAVAYGLGRKEELVAIYDFGGGTFDFTLVRIEAGRFEVKGQAGDAWLGGDDFDIALASHAAMRFEEQRNVDLRKREVEWQHLLFLAERVKRKLSVEKVAELHAKGLLVSVRGPVDLRLRVDRPLLTSLCDDLVDRSIATMSDCLDQLGVKPRDVDRVVMVGGVSRMPLVRERVEEFFDRSIRLAVDPEQVVVAGNAIFGRMVALNEPVAAF